MNGRLKAVGTGLLTACGCFALVGLGMAGLELRTVAKNVQADVHTLLTSLQPPIHETRQLIRDGRLTLDNANKAAIDERFYLEKQLPITIAKVDGVLDAAQVTVASVQPVTAAATRSLDETTARLHDLESMEAQASTVLHDADVVVNDPHIAETLAHVDAATANLADTAQHLDGTAADTETAVHKFLHPSWAARIANWSAPAVHAIGGWF